MTTTNTQNKNNDNDAKQYSMIHVENINPKDLDISNFLTSKFDYVVKSAMYKVHETTLATYELLRQIMTNKTTHKLKSPIITLSSDTAISGSTIAGVAERYIYATKSDKPIQELKYSDQKTVFTSDLKIIYIDSSPDLVTKKYSNYADYDKSILADVMGLTDSSFTNRRVLLKPENITLIGINDTILDDEQQEIINKHKINMFTLNMLRKKGIGKIISSIIEDIKHDNVHIVFDLSSVSQIYTPSAFRDENNKDGFTLEELSIMFKEFNKLEHLNSLDITGYYFGPKDKKDLHNKSNMITMKTIETVIRTIINIKEHSINVFNDDSRFLIWKRMDIKDHGWSILRGLSLKDREQIIKEIGNDKITTIPITDDDETYDAYVTTTSIKDQEGKSYYATTNIFDCCLYPGEKVNMMFELLNTPSNNLNNPINAEKTENKDTLIKFDLIEDEQNQDQILEHTLDVLNNDVEHLYNDNDEKDNEKDNDTDIDDLIEKFKNRASTSTS